jgi:arylsulfatase
MGSYERESVPWNLLDSEERRRNERLMEIYAAMIGNMDFHIGRLIDYLRSTDQLQNTFILFMSDNGTAPSFRPLYANPYDNSIENIGAKDSFVAYGQGWAEAGMAPFRGVKGAITEGGMRVAAFAHHSSVNKPGGISQNYLTVQDVMPTLLQLAGAKHPGNQFNHRPVLTMRGSSFLDHLRGGDDPVHPSDEVIGWEFSGKRVLVRGNWKLLKMPSKSGLQTNWELYDLHSDPYERNDLASFHPELMRELVDEWYDYANEVGVAGIEKNRIYNGLEVK